MSVGARMTQIAESSEYMPVEPSSAVGARVVVPSTIAASGERAVRRFLEFFAATIRNGHTRQAYYRACVRFFAWCDRHGLTDLPLIEPLHVAAYFEAMGREFEMPTVKQHLAAIRMLFDWLVTGGLLAVNPAAPVRGPCDTAGQDAGAHSR
jgi:integrase/recombinase XerC